jgi:hypothetical protein
MLPLLLMATSCVRITPYILAHVTPAPTQVLTV